MLHTSGLYSASTLMFAAAHCSVPNVGVEAQAAVVELFELYLRIKVTLLQWPGI